MDDLRQVRVNKLPSIPRVWQGSRMDATRCQEFAQNIEEWIEDKGKRAVHGRVIAKRGGGKIIFLDVRDRTGKMQVFLELATLGEETFSNLKATLDIGDIVEAFGEVFVTAAGEPTIRAEEFSILSKSLLPPPIGKMVDGAYVHNLSDTELQRRKRHLHLIAEPEAIDLFERRSHILHIIRDYLYWHGFIEVETPILQDLRGGANARPFITFHEAAEKEMYLRIAPELYLKRLLVGGFERIYEIGKNFRNEGSDSSHNPEFTMLECYAAYEDYLKTMSLIESMLQHLTRTGGMVQKPWNCFEPFKRITYFNALDFVMPEGVSAEQLFMEKDNQYILARSAAEKIGVDLPQEATFPEIVDRIFKKAVLPSMTEATFVMDYPVTISPLAKRKEDNPELTERYQLIVGGFEIANGFSELNDPIDQRGRFEAQRLLAADGDKEAMPMDEDFLEALEYAMPPASGFGIGIDRLVMVLSGAVSIRDVILFPTNKNSAGN